MWKGGRGGEGGEGEGGEGKGGEGEGEGGGHLLMLHGHVVESFLKIVFHSRCVSQLLLQRLRSLVSYRPSRSERREGGRVGRSVGRWVVGRTSIHLQFSQAKFKFRLLVD